MTVITHSFTPRGRMRDLFECRDPEVLLSGPAGTGKSRAALEKLHLLMLVNPGARGLVVRKTLASLGSTALVTWREYVVPEALKTGLVTFYGGSTQEAAQYRYTNGSCVVIGGMDKATKIMSSEYDVAYAQEAIELTENDVETITTRLRNGKISFQQLIMDTNPGPSHHWLKKRCDRGQCTPLNTRHEDNPVLFSEPGKLTVRGVDYMSKLDQLTGVRKQRLRHGRWVAAEGVIYEGWDPDVHLVDRFEIPDDWTRWWVVDFGFTNPFVLQWWAEDPDGRLYLYREIYHTQRLVEDHARDALAQVTRIDETGGVTWTEPRPRAVICDHDAEDRATLRRHLGMSTNAAKKSVSDGIQAVQARLKVLADGRPRLLVMRDSVVEVDAALRDAGKPVSTEQEFTSYTWMSPTGDRPPREEPLKQDDHGMDCTRYLVADRDLRGRTNVRWM